jgi:hypothetical protein
MRNQTDAVSVAAMDNAARLIASIFKQYGWTVEKNLVTHNYWTNYKETGKKSADLDAQNLRRVTNAKANPKGKYCPCYILPQWEKFKALVKKYMRAAVSVPATTPNPAPAATPAPKPSASSETALKVGDLVKCKSGVTKYSNGKLMASFVPSAKLYVRAIEQDGKILLVSIDPTAKVYTGRVNATDVEKM